MGLDKTGGCNDVGRVMNAAGVCKKGVAETEALKNDHDKTGRGTKIKFDDDVSVVIVGVEAMKHEYKKVCRAQPDDGLCRGAIKKAGDELQTTLTGTLDVGGLRMNLNKLSDAFPKQKKYVIYSQALYQKENISVV